MSGSQKNRRPTQRTIAAKAGFSVGTVSRALADDPLIAPETRALVYRIARELGYTPDRAAQRLRTGRSNVIGLILPPHEEILGFGTSLIRGISTVLSGTRYHLVVFPDFDTEQTDAQVQRVVKEGLADGILFSRTEPNDLRVRYLLEEDFPFVCHGRTELASKHAFVDFDNLEFARVAAKGLVAKGASNLAILMPPEGLTFRNHLMQGFMSAVRESGVNYEILDGVTLDSSPTCIEAAIKQRFSMPNRPDGLILPGEMSGLASLAAIQDLGLVMGKDVHVVVKQTSGIFDFVRPRIPSLYEDLTAGGEMMAKLLLRRIAGEPSEDLQFLQAVNETA